MGDPVYHFTQTINLTNLHPSVWFSWLSYQLQNGSESVHVYQWSHTTCRGTFGQLHHLDVNILHPETKDIQQPLYNAAHYNAILDIMLELQIWWVLEDNSEMIFLFLSKYICCDSSLEQSKLDGSNDGYYICLYAVIWKIIP